MRLRISIVSWVIAAAACGSDATDGSVDGPALFAKYCSTCHGPVGKPPESMALRLGVRDLTSPELRAKATAAFVEQQIRTGSANKLMPSFESLISDAQIKSLAAWVASPQFLAPR